MNDLFNGMSVSIDWIEYTFDVEKSYGSCLHILGLDGVMNELEHGGLGYRRMYRHYCEDITLFCDGNADMGVHLRVKGCAVASFFRSFCDSLLVDSPFGLIYPFDLDSGFSSDNVCAYMFHLLADMGHFTRLDVAIDDTRVYFSVGDIDSYRRNGQIVSKMRNYMYTLSGEMRGKKTGETVYFGSRQSDVMLRIYDKCLQTKADFPWVRWEFECKGDKLAELVKVISNRVPLGEVAFGLLSSYFRIVLLDDDNQTRRSVLPLWREFTAACSPLKLTVVQRQKTIDDKIGWLNRQVMPTIAGLCKYFDGDMSFVYNNLEEHYNRLKESDRRLYGEK